MFFHRLDKGVHFQKHSLTDMDLNVSSLTGNELTYLKIGESPMVVKGRGMTFLWLTNIERNEVRNSVKAELWSKNDFNSARWVQSIGWNAWLIWDLWKWPAIAVLKARRLNKTMIWLRLPNAWMNCENFSPNATFSSTKNWKSFFSIEIDLFECLWCLHFPHKLFSKWQKFRCIQ